MRRQGDGFLRCSDGHTRWGLFGAAGAVFVAPDPRTGDPLVMLQLRSGLAHEGGTWSCAGGALDEGEAPLQAAFREACEEVGPLPASCAVIGEFVFAPATDWSYTTVVALVPEPFGGSVNFETDAVEWVGVADVEQRALHPGFAAAWPHLRAIIEHGPASGRQ